MVGLIPSIAAFTLPLAGIIGAYNKRKKERPDLDYYKRISIEGLLGTIKSELSDLVRDDDMIIASDVNYEATMRTKAKASKALTSCVSGDGVSRKIVIAMIRDIIERELPNVKTVNEIINTADLTSVDPMMEFEIILYKLGKKYGTRVLIELNRKYNINVHKDAITNKCSLSEAGMEEEASDACPEGNEVKGESEQPIFDYDLLDRIFKSEVAPVGLTYDEALDVIAILLFQRYKGFGCIDTLLRLEIDGLNFGTSGSLRYKIDGKYDEDNRDTNSVWVQLETVWVHFPFLDFYKEESLKRTINQLVSNGSAAPMTEKVPKKVSQLPDGSRVTAIRPGAGEGWGVWVRKFMINKMSVIELLDKKGIENAEIPAKLIKYLMKAEETEVVSGQQNSGKTTMLRAAIEHIREGYNIRALEQSFELGLREAYPERNTFAVRPTDYTTMEEMQDTLKKTDAAVSIMGEIATAKQAARMIDFCLVASQFTLSTYHGKDDYALINGLANQLVASGEYEDHTVATATVLDVIKHNCHMSNIKNERVVEYMSEIVKCDEIQPYPEIEECTDTKAAVTALARVQREYYTRETDRVRFTSNRIMHFDAKLMSYVADEWYTKETEARIKSKLKPREIVEFDAFRDKYWGGVK